MSSELKGAFAALSEEAGRAQLEPAETLRRRGDRRRAYTVAATTAAAAVLVAGVLVGSRLVLSDPSDPVPMPAPADSFRTVVPSSPAAAAPSRNPPSTTPPTTPTTPTTPAMPSSIPARAFLQASDAPGKVKEPPHRLGSGDQPLPRFCDDYDPDHLIGVRATQNLLFAEADAPPESTPKSAVYEDITVYEADGAEAFMGNLRAAVQGCPSQQDDVGVTVRNYLRGSLGVGDQSVLIEQTRPATDDAGEPVGGGALHHRYWAAVRSGDSVAFVSNTGWESVSADRADTVHLGERAAARLAAWRG